MRRTPAAIDSSLTILKKAMSPVRRTWVPPQSSLDGPSVTTRTVSPYFSPKIIMAPDLRASSMRELGGVGRRVRPAPAR